MSINYLFCLEMRPLPTGEWDCEDHIATFQGDVECILRHPNPRSTVRPRRMRLPMIYIMHVPSAYTYRFSTPSMYPNRSPGVHGFSPSLSRERIVREYGSDPPQRYRTPSPPRYTPGERYVHVVEEEEGTTGEEDPIEGSTGSAWGMD